MVNTRRITHSLLLSTLLAGSCLASENLGIISIDSTTIDDRFGSKQTEVSSTSTISGEAVDAAHIENLQQVLQSIPGITTEVSSGESIKIHMRGVENQMYMGEKPGVAVVIDGVPVFERTGSVNIDLDNIESVKVIKGGASYLFGDDALSGAVIITTKKGAKYNHTSAAIEKGSYGYQKLLAQTGYANDSMNTHIQVSERKADGYWEDSSYSAKYLNGKLQYYLDSTSDITFGAEYSKRKKDTHGTVGGATEAENNPKSIYEGYQPSRDYAKQFDVDLMKLFLTYSKDFSNGANWLANAYIYTDTTDFLSSPQTKDATGVKRAYYDDNDYVYDNHYEQTQKGVKSEYRDTFFNTSAGMFGLDIRDNDYKNKVTYLVDQKIGFGPTATYPKAGDLKSDDVTNEKVYAVYGEYKYLFNSDLSTTVNLRHDTIKLDYADNLNHTHNKNFRVYSYRIGADYKILPQTTLFANFSTGFRAPTVAQLYAGDNSSAYDPALSNPNLKPEQSKNYEIGLRGDIGKMKYESSLFQIDRKDFIMKSSGNYGAATGTYTWDNIGGAKHRGLEVSLLGDISDDVSFNLAYTYLLATYTNYKNFGIDLDGNPNTTTVTTFDVTGNVIPRTSKHNVNLILNYKATQNLLLTSELNAKSSYYADDLNKLEIAGQATLNFLSTYKFKFNDFDCSVFGRIDNVFDKQYYNTARSSSDRDSNGIFNSEDLSITVNPGRVYTAGLSLKF